MTLIIGARYSDSIILAADRRRLTRYGKGPETTKLFKLNCVVILVGAGDDAVLNEAWIFIYRRSEESQSQSSKWRVHYEKIETNNADYECTFI